MTSPRRGRPGPLLASALLLAAPLGTARAAGGPGSPIVSGLAWRSGANGGGIPCLAQLRGRPLDASHTFLTRQSFPAMVSNAAAAAGGAKRAPLWVVSVPLLTNGTGGQFAQCAAGAFDGYFRQVGANLKAAGARATVARIGWEANTASHPWSVRSQDQIPAYKSCFRRAALALKAGGQGVLVEWANAKRGTMPVLRMYPGDDVVDVIGVHYYDSGPVKSTQALWDKYYDATFLGGPFGLGAWLRMAQAHGKKLGMGEWGVWQQSGQTAAQTDDPVYMDNMYRFFRANAPSIAYETYFNTNAGDGGHALCPTTVFPRAAARYKADWGGGK